jgi:hypothetical protein
VVIDDNSISMMGKQSSNGRPEGTADPAVTRITGDALMSFPVLAYLMCRREVTMHTWVSFLMNNKLSILNRIACFIKPDI